VRAGVAELIGSSLTLKPFRNRVSVPDTFTVHLESALNDSDPKVRGKAVEYSCHLPDRGRLLRNVALTDEDVSLRLAAVKAFAGLDGVEVYFVGMSDRDPQVQKASIIALGNSGLRDNRAQGVVTGEGLSAAQVLDALLGRLNDGSAEIARDAEIALAKLDPARLSDVIPGWTKSGWKISTHISAIYLDKPLAPYSTLKGSTAIGRYGCQQCLKRLCFELDYVLGTVGIHSSVCPMCGDVVRIVGGDSNSSSTWLRVALTFRTLSLSDELEITDIENIYPGDEARGLRIRIC